LQGWTAECRGTIDAFAVCEREAPGRLHCVGIRRLLQHSPDQVVDHMQGEAPQAVIDAAIACLQLLVGRPPIFFGIDAWWPGQAGPIECLTVDESPELLLARAPERAPMETADDLMQHSVVRLGVHEPVGPQDQRLRGTLKRVRLRHEAVPPGDGLAIERFRDAMP
jgi:hypothetical protein